MKQAVRLPHSDDSISFLFSVSYPSEPDRISASGEPIPAEPTDYQHITIQGLCKAYYVFYQCNVGFSFLDDSRLSSTFFQALFKKYSSDFSHIFFMINLHVDVDLYGFKIWIIFLLKIPSIRKIFFVFFSIKLDFLMKVFFSIKIYFHK